MPKDGPIALETQNSILEFDSHTAQLVSFRSKAAKDQEFIASIPDHPAFVIGYLDSDHQYRLVGSSLAQAVNVRCQTSADGGSRTLTAEFERISGLDLAVRFSVHASKDDAFSRWSITVSNNAVLPIVDVQFPFIVCKYRLAGRSGSETLVLPQGGSGQLIRSPDFSKLGPDNMKAWEFSQFHDPSDHYPGSQFAQFVAYYNDRAGLYIACEDAAGNVKRFKAVHREPGFRLGVAHVGDWPAKGEHHLEYEIVLGSFVGDWYSAADIYRDWSLRQRWAVPLHKRDDVPAWLLDSPVYITIRPQGVLDEGPVLPIGEFLPYEKCLPLLERVSEAVRAPLAIIMMGWERGGSWIYPDCFPPVGGEDSVEKFTRLARQRGWHLGSFCNGTRWVIGHCWNDYDGRDHFRRNGGDLSISRQSDGSAWVEWWGWRLGLLCCLGTKKTRQVAVDFIRRLVGWGLESLQFFDQNMGAATFPCYATDHEHPPLPGKWMHEKMKLVIEEFRQVAREAGEHGVIYSAEAGVNEFCLPLFQETDIRIFPPGYANPYFIPLYHFLFHEMIIIQGMMGNSPEPYHLPIRNAMNCVLGEIPGAVMVGDGTLLNKDTGNWAPWEPKVGSNKDALEMIRTVTALRRGPGRDFLVFGRMMRPADVRGIQTVRWNYHGRATKMPAVFHSAWRAPDGRLGVVLANWTGRTRVVTVGVTHLGCSAGSASMILHVAGRRLLRREIKTARGRVRITLPPMSCALLRTDRSPTSVTSS